MVFKLLAVVIILFLVYLVFFKRDREKEIKKNNKRNEDKKIEAIMEECPRCKTFVAKDDAILSNGKYYCSKECL
ncbi:MAG: hypothetical protein HRT42_07855 [Campylobacteraceae bacterium]|nr:hypothetical protein [Campylobacteraceae bacterium]